MKTKIWIIGLALVGFYFTSFGQCAKSKLLIITVRDLNGNDYRSLEIALTPTNLTQEAKIGYNRQEGWYEKTLDYPVGKEVKIALSSSNFIFREEEKPEATMVVKAQTCVIYAVFRAIPLLTIDFHSSPKGVIIYPYRHPTDFNRKEPSDKEISITVILDHSEDLFRYNFKIKPMDWKGKEILYLKKQLIEIVDETYKAYSNTSVDRDFLNRVTKDPDMKGHFAKKIKYDTVKVTIK